MLIIFIFVTQVTDIVSQGQLEAYLIFEHCGKQTNSGAIVCFDKNQFLGPGNKKISGILFGLVFILVKNVDACT